MAAEQITAEHTAAKHIAAKQRFDDLEDPHPLFRCRTILNCVDVCPKNLLPTEASGKIKEVMVSREF